MHGNVAGGPQKEAKSNTNAQLFPSTPQAQLYDTTSTGSQISIRLQQPQLCDRWCYKQSICIHVVKDVVTLDVNMSLRKVSHTYREEDETDARFSNTKKLHPNVRNQSTVRQLSRK